MLESKENFDGETFYIINKKYQYAKLTQWGFKPREMGTYSGEYVAEMLWILHTDENNPGYYFINNCDHLSYISKWGKADDEVGVDKGGKSDDQLWKFDKQ